jgi:DNA repair protein RadC
MLKSKPKQRRAGAPARVHISSYRFKTFHVDVVKEPAVYPLGEKLCWSKMVASAARAIFRTLDADKEHFLLITLNNKNVCGGFKVISTGSLTASLVHPREVWGAAIRLTAAAVVFVHNHPSGDPTPSQEDIEITRRLKEVGDVMGVRVLDHVVLGDKRFFSFSDKGML